MKNWRTWLTIAFSVFCLSTCGDTFTEPTYSADSVPSCKTGTLVVYEANGSLNCKQ